jgi:hypothetical protein
MRDYLANCFWLLLPVLALNLLFSRQLPAAYQPGVFWRDIPRWISVPENLLRTLVMILPVIMRLRVSTPVQKLGLWIYFAGLAAYFTSWAALILFPWSGWSTSAIGFMAPAFTPIIWLVGIGLLGGQLLFTTVPFRSWMYWILSALFLVFHNLHAATVYSRGI